VNEFTALRRLTAYALVLCIPIALNGCAGAGLPGTDTPPEIPPSSTFVMNFDEFANGGTAKIIDRDKSPIRQQTIDNGNWGWGALHVGVWNALVTIGMVVPVAAFVESFNHEAQQQEDGSWVWSYQVTVSGVVHTAELHGATSGGNVEWDMFITKEGFYDHFNWFSGVSNLPGTEGTWTLYNSPDNPTPLLSIDWHRDPLAETGDIRYTNTVPDGPENGGYIYFGTTANPMDAFYEIFNKGENNTINIEWSRTARNGRIKDSAHFGDDQWHCWDGSLKDTACQ